jgi:hypothetical protein
MIVSGGAAMIRVIALAVLFGLSSIVAAQAPPHRTFASAEEAVKALVDTVRQGDVDALLAIFGPEGRTLFASSDPATARMNQRVFIVAAREQWHLEDAPPNAKTLVIGNENWPFPVPIVKSGEGWRFDTAAGKEEVIARRIGRNELDAIATVRAYVAAQRRYAAQAHDGRPAGAYAVRFRSDPGKQNGLYWPAARDQERSPLGDLVAAAAEDGRGSERGPRTPFRGYYYKILTGQGAAAPGGAKNYIVKGDMTGGFALVAWPAQYDETGVMTFIVSQDGIVRERDLGPQTESVAQKMTLYNPDATWRPVQ